MYNTDIPLQNHSPRIIGVEAVNQWLVYPESTLCTLTVLDRNDDSVSCAFFAPNDSTTPLALQHNPHAIVHADPSAEKTVELYFGGSLMGVLEFQICIRDPHDALICVPCRIEKVFADSFNSFSLDTLTWKTYYDNDTQHITTDYADWKLRFHFDTTGQSNDDDCITGIRSRFHTKGDFTASIDFELRDDMIGGFYVGFWASTSSDTGKYAGRQFGIFLEGAGDWVNVKCQSGWSMYSKNVDYFSGRLRLQRQGELVSFACRDANPLSEMEHMSSFDFSEADTSLFFHLTMEVEDHSRMRHCEWDNFMIESGEVVFDDGS